LYQKSSALFCQCVRFDESLVPMNAAQIQASGGANNGNKTPTPAQIQNQIQLQAQALVHAHTQAQFAANIYKGDTTAVAPAAPAPAAPAPAARPPPPTVPTSTGPPGPLLPSITPAQLTQKQTTKQAELSRQHSTQLSALRARFQQDNLACTPTMDTRTKQSNQLSEMTTRHEQEMQRLRESFRMELSELHEIFRKQNAAAEYAGVRVNTVPTPATTTTAPATPAHVISNPPAAQTAASVESSSMMMVNGAAAVTTTALSTQLTQPHTPTAHPPGVITTSPGAAGANATSSATSPAFLARLSTSLSAFWSDQLRQMRNLGTTTPPQTEQDFKNHNDLPLARIKRIMKSDEDVRMISAEAPVLFAKACEMFILELTLRSWSYSENNKRRTLQKEDIREAIQRTDIFDFLVDVIH